MPDSPEDQASPESVAPETVAEENKRKFREALEHKKNRRGEDHIDHTSNQPDAHGPVDQKRTFRRKTG